MKYVIVLGDGMADYPIPQLDNKTPLQYARKPNIDFLAQHGKVGIVQTIPEGIPPGSDSANLSVMGYNPRVYYTGRSPLEAVSMGIELSDSDVAIRCNLVTLSEEENYRDKVMLDHSSDEITSEEAKILIEEINSHFKTADLNYYPGVSYRHCLIWKNGLINLNLTPPHDVLDKKVTDYLPQGEDNKILLNMMVESSKFLKDHPVNKARTKRGLRPANSIWLWGEGKKPALASFYDKYHLNGSVVSAVDLIKGIGICAGLKSVEVEGATGNTQTNFSGKVEAVLKELESGQDFVYLHIEAPDECGHHAEIDNKVRSIELIDEKIVSILLKEMEKYDDYRLLILPDHPTPIALRTHTTEPVPFLLYQKTAGMESGLSGYDEFQAKETGLFFKEGYSLMDYFLMDYFIKN
ncbi:MAG: cofactor-independent phosphoglycerate mutase [Desulfitobacteriaceae bacterium]|nr:cofactor-independent phosphoglycerate mutase [Desulfitobacteriaceae bacterium]MDD4345702.1 cofactor-independent phosphoglycerate mutase [Desulfitobacteriaceae bacterium]MDD4401352.1 cofactor-independent phosphoglycerate mutase [Desulfitobacteriaceae bacterium]